MAQVYPVVRWILVILLACEFLWDLRTTTILSVLGLFKPEMIEVLVLVLLSILITLFGLYGAYRQLRTCLITYAVIKAVTLAAAILLAGYFPIHKVVLVGLALWQAELIKRGAQE